MARISRLVVPGYPHHVTQRGVRSIPARAIGEAHRRYTRMKNFAVLAVDSFWPGSVS